MKNYDSNRLEWLAFTRHQLLTSAWVLAFCLSVLALAGCKSTGYDKSDAVARRLLTTAGGMRAQVSNLDLTISSLTNLLANPSGDLRIQFAQFSASLDQLADSSKHATGDATSLQNRSADFFREWDEQLAKMNDGTIRQLSAARETVVKSQYTAAFTHFQAAQNSLLPVITYLHDIRKALVTDLTAAGLQSVKVPVANSQEQCSKARTALSQSADDLDDLSGKMSSFITDKAKG